MLLPAPTLRASDAAAGLAQTFWHSSAHVLGEALEACFGAKLTIGPALEEGFYYDCYLGEHTLTEADKAALEKQVQQVRPAALPAYFTPALLCMVLRRLWDWLSSLSAMPIASRCTVRVFAMHGWLPRSAFVRCQPQVL